MKYIKIFKVLYKIFALLLFTVNITIIPTSSTRGWAEDYIGISQKDNPDKIIKVSFLELR